MGKNEEQDAWLAMPVVCIETRAARTIFDNKNGPPSDTVWGLTDC